MSNAKCVSVHLCMTKLCMFVQASIANELQWSGSVD